MRNLRDYARQTNIRLVLGFALLLLTIGVGLIYLIYGGAAAASGAACIGIVLIPVGLIWLSLQAIDRLARRLSDD